jgi:cytochrome P450
MPFGAGQRLFDCRALALHEAMLTLATIASRFSLKLEPRQTVTPEAGLTMRPLGGMKMRAQAR